MKNKTEEDLVLPALGCFSNPGSIHIGDPFTKKMEPDSRYTGKQVITNPSKRGQISDNWGGKYAGYERLFDGEKHDERIMEERKERQEKEAKNLTRNGFVYANPPKKSTGSGDIYGTIGGPITYKEEGPSPRAKIPEPKKPFITNPPKKGSSSFPNITIGKSPPHVPEPYDQARIIAKKQFEAEKKKRLDGVFKPMSKSLDYFDTYPDVAASKIYTSDRAMPPMKQRPQKLEPIPHPFYPSHAPLTGLKGNFDKFPEYQSSPYDAMHKLEIERAHADKKKAAGGPWRSSGPSKAPPQPSISAQNITLNTILVRNSI